LPKGFLQHPNQNKNKKLEITLAENLFIVAKIEIAGIESA